LTAKNILLGEHTDFGSTARKKRKIRGKISRSTSPRHNLRRVRLALRGSEGSLWDFPAAQHGPLITGEGKRRTAPVMPYDLCVKNRQQNILVITVEDGKREFEK